MDKQHGNRANVSTCSRSREWCGGDSALEQDMVGGREGAATGAYVEKVAREHHTGDGEGIHLQAEVARDAARRSQAQQRCC